MKNKFLKVITLSSAVFALGAGLLLNINKEPQQVDAATHVDNYASYTYSGTYYSSITDSLTDGLHGTLRKNLGTLVRPKSWFTYSGSSAGTTGKELQEADEDPLNSNNMILLYTRDSISKRAAGGTVSDWNREHVWPQDLSNGHWGKAQAGTDILHLRPTWSKTNGNRGNTKYGDCNHSNLQTYEGMPYAYTNGSYFEPLDTVKGDVARILMYVWTAYYDYYNDTSLLLTRTIQSYDVLLKWHTLDKPDILEGNRNDYVQTTKQKNRNPFVDHPEYAWRIFGDQVSASVKEDCMAAYPDPTHVTPPPSSSSSKPAESSSILISSSMEQSSSAAISSSSIEQSSSEASSSEYSSSEASSESEYSSIQNSCSYCVDVSSSSAAENESYTSIEVSSTPADSSSATEPKKKSDGCHGSITVLPVAGISALIGLVFVFSKKKRK